MPKEKQRTKGSAPHHVLALPQKENVLINEEKAREKAQKAQKAQDRSKLLASYEEILAQNIMTEKNRAETKLNIIEALGEISGLLSKVKDVNFRTISDDLNCLLEMIQFELCSVMKEKKIVTNAAFTYIELVELLMNKEILDGVFNEIPIKVRIESLLAQLEVAQKNQFENLSMPDHIKIEDLDPDTIIFKALHHSNLTCFWRPEKGSSLRQDLSDLSDSEDGWELVQK